MHIEGCVVFWKRIANLDPCVEIVIWFDSHTEYRDSKTSIFSALTGNVIEKPRQQIIIIVEHMYIFVRMVTFHCTLE